MSKATDTQWRVQVRKNRNHAWKNQTGLFETRAVARGWCAYWRDGLNDFPGYGFGNTRVVKYQKVKK